MVSPRPAALLVDVGFTITFPDGARIAELAAAAGVRVTAGALDAAEPALRAEIARFSWATRPGAPVAPGGGVRFFRRFLDLAGASADEAALDAAAAAIWEGHLERNVWCRPGRRVREALAELRGAGVRLAVVSNSEGTIDRLLRDLGLRDGFEAVLDSWVEGVAKPDPRIFARALERLGARPEDAVMVGDSPSADVAGARAAGIRAALLDPFDLYPDAGAPRFPDFAAFAAALLASR